MSKSSRMCFSVALYAVMYWLSFVITPKISEYAGIKQYPSYCDHLIEFHQTSTSRDVVFFALDSYHPGLMVAIKSLRSVGSLCRIVLLMPSSIDFPYSAQKVIKESRVEMFSPPAMQGNRSYVPHMLRYEYELEWLKIHGSEVSRVFHADAFDVFFQKDPFTSKVKTNKLYFAVEPHSFRSCGWNLAWMVECYGEDEYQKLRNMFIVCSGSIIGGAKIYRKLIEEMIRLPEWSRCWKSSFDQPILNHMLWTGVIDQMNIKYELLGCDSDIYTIQWCVFNNQIIFDDDKYLLSLNGYTPAFVHQYNRNLTLQSFVYKSCSVYPIPKGV